MTTQLLNTQALNEQVLNEQELQLLDKWWHAANYLSVGQLYLLDNPLLEEPLTREQIKRKIVGHWGTVPGQNFIYTHLNRMINKYDLNMIYLSGPGHGGNAMVAQDWMDGSYSEVYPNIGQDKDGLQKLFKHIFPAFSFSSIIMPFPYFGHSISLALAGSNISIQNVFIHFVILF